MEKKLKKLARYFYRYKFYGFWLYVQIYCLKKKKIKLKGYQNFYFRKNSSDAEVFTQMFIYRQYEMKVSGAVKTIIDLGGNNGMSAVYFHRQYPEAMIYVLEPDKENFELLKKHTEGLKRIVCLNKAIWKQNGFVNMDLADCWALKIDVEKGTHRVEAITMEVLINDYQIKQIDLLKIDIESSEKEIFESSIEFLSLTRNLIIELHDWIKPGCAKSFFKALSMFSYTYTINRENTEITNLTRNGFV